ncbi:MAG: signal peptidase I [Chloroflexi bacterium]|nr:signal peptidase I [Chloroflexota bacterium]
MSYEPTPPELSQLDRQNVVSLDLPQPSPARRFLVETIQTIGLALVLFLIINFVSTRIRVDGQSMEPTFHDGDYVIVNRLTYRTGDFKRGDVVVFPFPHNREEDFIKRVIALPGDRILIQGGSVFVNDVAIEEDYLAERTLGNMAEEIVPPGHVFVMGDNRNDSSDSRVWGPLSTDEIIGKAVFRYWPFSNLGTVVHHEIALTAP